MAVKIRLRRTGRVGVATYRIVVADSRSPRDGRFIAEVGYYHPEEDNKVVLDKEAILGWLQQGAQPSATVRSILANAGIMKEYREFKINAAKAKKENENAKA